MENNWIYLDFVSDNTIRDRINQDFVSIVIEKILVDISIDTYHKVMSALDKEEKFLIYDHLESLKAVLQDLFGECHSEILNKIKTELQRHGMDTELSRFG